MLERAGAHSDYGSLTLLFLNPVGGLQVQRKDGSWADASYIPGAVLVNTGDLMMRWTNDQFKSTVHRVSTPTDQSQFDKHRYSIAYFCHPDDEIEISPISFLDDATLSKYPPISARDYLLMRLGQTY
eukprot:TRINITY_DN6727_c0_g1_i1.p1 TRINITY_DN6727_c0_g1~~TRINITY_DN6727_c0_g1_i1.p1  ORF type:complete len:127 (+),score=13.49 TRINITY_DN6727_c0_g1_i1:807-1187(+)